MGTASAQGIMLSKKVWKYGCSLHGAEEEASPSARCVCGVRDPLQSSRQLLALLFLHLAVLDGQTSGHSGPFGANSAALT